MGKLLSPAVSSDLWGQVTSHNLLKILGGSHPRARPNIVDPCRSLALNLRLLSPAYLTLYLLLLCELPSHRLQLFSLTLKNVHSLSNINPEIFWYAPNLSTVSPAQTYAHPNNTYLISAAVGGFQIKSRKTYLQYIYLLLVEIKV